MRREPKSLFFLVRTSAVHLFRFVVCWLCIQEEKVCIGFVVYHEFMSFVF